MLTLVIQQQASCMSSRVSTEEAVAVLLVFIKLCILLICRLDTSNWLHGDAAGTVFDRSFSLCLELAWLEYHFRQLL